MKRLKTGLAMLLLMTAATVFGSDKVIRLYLDADLTGTAESSASIEQGIRLALSETGYKIKGYTIELVKRNHNGNARRSSLHIREFLDDPDALAMFCGLHSPPVLANLPFIQENDVLLLDPWAAAGPITRSPAADGDNWVFRLSVDDTKAGEFITSFAVDLEGFQKPVLLLEDTGWGDSNRHTMTEALSVRGISPLGIIRFDWNTGYYGANEIIQDIYNMGADVVFLVANAKEGKSFIKAMSARRPEHRLPIRSHWGITGGSLFEDLGADILVEKVDLKFIQTSFSFTSANRSVFAEDVFGRTAELFDEISHPGDIKAPSGFIHAYDLTRILLKSLEQSEISGRGADLRLSVKDALESLDEPVRGLIKIYAPPFSVYSGQNPDAHEALNIEDLVMARYTEEGLITLIGKSEE